MIRADQVLTLRPVSLTSFNFRKCVGQKARRKSLVDDLSLSLIESFPARSFSARLKTILSRKKIGYSFAVFHCGPNFGSAK